MKHSPTCLSRDNILGKHACDCKDTPPLMFDQMRYEQMVTRYEERIYLLRRTLEGLATNSTQCGMCQMHNEIMLEALAKDEALQSKT